VKIIITEEQLKRIILEQTKPAPVKPKNQTFTTTQDRILTKDTLTGGQIKIPKGTRFTAHQDNFGPTTKYTVSVDRVEDGKIKPSTIFYCNSTNAGKFWNGASKSWYYDKTKALSGYLSKNLCTKSYGDKYYWENSAKWAEQKAKKEEFARCSKDGKYVNAKGGKDCYHNSTEFQKNTEFLQSQGLLTRGWDGTPTSPNQHFDLSALYSIKEITNSQINELGWNNTECMRIGLASIKSTPHKSKYLNAYDSSVKALIDDPKSRLYTAPNFAKTSSPSYVNFVLSDFYFEFGKLAQSVNGGGRSAENLGSWYFPEGVYNFMATYYGTTNIAEIKNTIRSKKARCEGGGMTAEQGHKVISTLTFISAFIPFVGPFIAAGLGTADAAILWSQGKKGEAALTAGLSLIPFASEIPGLKGVGQEVFKSIASKTIGKIPLNASEISVVNQISAAKGEFDGIAKKWITNNSSNPLVKEFTNIAKEKGEEALIAKVKEKSGINKYVPLTKKDAISIAKDTTKDQIKGAVKKYDA
jgi:hypothetical protein